MLSECIEGLNINPDGIYVDGTLGGGGHSFHILQHLRGGRLIGIDRDETGITINEEMEGTAKKKNVSFTNDGFADGYIRAAIVGFWKNAHGDIVVPWSDDKLSTPEYGSFDWGESKTYWKKGKNDTFYYYNKIVSRGETTKPLFNAYTITSETPIDGAVLEIDIVAQLIKYDNMTAYWGSNWPW